MMQDAAYTLGNAFRKAVEFALPIAILSGMPVLGLHLGGWIDSPIAVYVLSLWLHLVIKLARGAQ